MEAVLCRGLRAAREIAVGNVNGSRDVQWQPGAQQREATGRVQSR